jgi:hypothetical protein
VFIEEQIERHGIRNFIESDFADLGELAKLADVIRNAIKYGTEETNKQIEVYHRLRQPSTQPDSRANSFVENSSTWGRRYDARTNSERGRFHRDASQGAGVLNPKASEDKALLRDEIERELGNGAQTMFSAKRKAPETVSVQDEHLQTVISSADGAKVLKDLDSAITEYENDTHTKEKTFLGRLAKILGATKHGSNSQYATFETMNGNIVPFVCQTIMQGSLHSIIITNKRESASLLPHRIIMVLTMMVPLTLLSSSTMQSSSAKLMVSRL